VRVRQGRAPECIRCVCPSPDATLGENENASFRRDRDLLQSLLDGKFRQIVCDTCAMYVGPLLPKSPEG
jgi:hypothetical protein